MPPKSPEGGLVGRVIFIKPTPYKSPFGGFRGQTRKAEKKIEFIEVPYNLGPTGSLAVFPC
jgi:hypothetical protein